MLGAILCFDSSRLLSKGFMPRRLSTRKFGARTCSSIASIVARQQRHVSSPCDLSSADSITRENEWERGPLHSQGEESQFGDEYIQAEPSKLET